MQSEEDRGKRFSIRTQHNNNCNSSSSNALRIAGTELGYVFRDFLNMEPTSMLIRGLPGTGKTTLALELMQLMHDKYNCFYISTRVSLARLQRYFPWIIGYLKDESVLSYDKIEKDSVIDLRLGSAAGTVELVIDTLINKKRAFVVLDSWDALAKEIKHDERMKMEKTMITVADTNDGFILFVSEEPEMNTLSYLVDGIVTLNVRDYDGVSIRSMYIDKMRGVALYNNNYAYTLLDSRFTLVPIQYNCTYCEYRDDEDDNGNDDGSSSGSGSSYRLFHVFDAREGFVSTGSRDMDVMLHGGLRYGSTLLLEVDPGFDMIFLNAILTCMIANSLNSNGKVMLDALDASLSSMMGSILPFCTDKVKNLTIFTSSKIDVQAVYEQWLNNKRRRKSKSINSLPSIVNVSDSNYTSIMLERYNELKRLDGMSIEHNDSNSKESATATATTTATAADSVDNTRRSILLILNRMHASSSRMHESMLLTNAKDNGDVTVIVERVGSSNIPYVKSISDVHLRLWSKSGVHLMHALKPNLGTYAILLDRERGYPSYLLLRMV
ncbi:MAG: gas vesicle protein GvpD P-loop domain-containing protein [Candidatus Nitrosocaldus sp.]